MSTNPIGTGEQVRVHVVPIGSAWRVDAGIARFLARQIYKLQREALSLPVEEGIGIVEFNLVFHTDRRVDTLFYVLTKVHTARDILIFIFDEEQESDSQEFWSRMETSLHDSITAPWGMYCPANSCELCVFSEGCVIKDLYNGPNASPCSCPLAFRLERKCPLPRREMLFRAMVRERQERGEITG
ncbi:MAG: hypothetical protein IPK84_00435 [Candidatus Moraniibacteriota bacterium]|nr:MAG: hypothetical protein IPK84_00435 [Candidatus Moranbacteria bacterium]